MYGGVFSEPDIPAGYLYDQALFDCVLGTMQATCPSISDPASRQQLRNMTDTFTPHMHDATAFLAATKAWPGILHLLASLLSAFPTPPARDADAPDATHGDPGAAAPMLPPQIATRIRAGAAQHVLLSEGARMALASLLPSTERRTWHLLFNSDMHGKSFATFFGRVTCQGPSLVVVKDKAGHVFGGYASEAWEKRGTFYGSAASFLFKLEPHFAVHFASGVNANFQWCAQKFSELPNGVGFGGQVGYFSMLINDDLDTGMSRPAATFAAPCLAHAETFEIDSVECWLVRREEEDGGGRTGRSALDRFKEDQVILELHGQQMHSHGVRDRPPSPDPEPHPAHHT